MNIKNVSIENIKEILLENRIIDSITNCWLWTGRLNANGYGIVCTPDGKDHLVHRVSYTHFNQEYIINLILHKTICPNKHCFNPEHLYEGTHADNMRDSISTGSHGNQYGPTAKTHCQNGHPLSGDNLRITTEGRRRCLTCQKEYNRKNWRKYPSSYIKHKNEK